MQTAARILFGTFLGFLVGSLACGGRVVIDCDALPVDQCLPRAGCIWDYASGACFTTCEDDADCGAPQTCENTFIQTSPEATGAFAYDACAEP